MIQANSICLSFGSQKIFDSISFTINQYQRIGLVGRNGSGKSTLLKAIMDDSTLDDGSITTISSKKIAYMPQEVVLNSELSIIDETCTAYHDLEAEEVGAAHAQAKKMLMGLGFSNQQCDMPVSTLSVGWKMRIVLAKLLLQDADFYLFDEPTNHLDLQAKEWFLELLKRSSFGFLLVCHERYFLDELCTDILDLEFGKAIFYKGNYSKYSAQKQHNLELLEAAFAQQQKEIKRKQETIERFRASASKAKMAQSMSKALDKVERITLPPSLKNVRFSFPPVQQSGRTVLTVFDVSYSFGSKQIFKNISCQIERHQKVALIAPNGVGKTTLFNLITGALPVQHGSITFGHNVNHAIFAQDQNKSLNGQLSIIDNIKNLCPLAKEQTIRTFLGAFLFSNEDIYKKVGVLSGGEKNRVGMVTVLLHHANLLLLDEPTNHLDIPSKEILLKALQDFNGTIFFVSHDRDFINALATDVIELTHTGAYHYVGNYDSYILHKKAISQPTASDTISSEPEAKKSTYELQKKGKRLEEKIARLEQQILDAQSAFADLEYGTPEFSANQDTLTSLQQELQKTEVDWEATVTELNSI